jgi:ribosomal protein L37E
MKRVTPEIAAGTESMERRKKYKVIRFRLGLCVNCGDERGDSLFKRICAKCGENKKKKRRKKLGSRPWKEGSPGRPPYAALPQDSGDGS